MSECRVDEVTREYIKGLAEDLGMNYDEAAIAIRDMGTIIVGDELDRCSIFDLIASDTDIENSYCEKEEIEGYMKSFNEAFKGVCESQKYLIASLSTALFCKLIVKHKIDISPYEFLIKDDVLAWIKYGKIKKQADIARELNADNASISVPWKRFCKRIKKDKSKD